MSEKKLNVRESLKVLEQSGILKKDITMNEIFEASKKTQEMVGGVEELADVSVLVHNNMVFLNVGAEEMVSNESLTDPNIRRKINPSIRKG